MHMHTHTHTHTHAHAHTCTRTHMHTCTHAHTHTHTHMHTRTHAHTHTHTQNLLTTNWQIARLKLPVPEQNIGWRVEFRTMEVILCERVTSYLVAWGREKSTFFTKIAHILTESILIFNTHTLFQLQLTSSENAAFAVFAMLLARMIIALRPKFYIPVTKVKTLYLDPLLLTF